MLLKNKCRNRSAFTLIELLVVVAIIALLMTILMPALGKAKIQARMVACAASMRQIGSGVMVFAQTHNDRAPGHGTFASSGNSTASWHEILNYEVFQNPNYLMRHKLTNFVYTQLSYNGKDGTYKSKIYCPDSYAVQHCTTGNPNTDNTDNYRCYTMNVNVYGGVDSAWGSQYPAWGEFGQDVQPPSTYISSFAVTYYLGAKLSMFQNPGAKYMIVEGDRANDVFYNNNNNNDAMGAAGFPWYDSTNGFFSFRHNLMLNSVFVDGHVEAIKFRPEQRNDRYMRPE